MPAPIKLALLPPQEAIDFFRQKGYRVGFDYRDVWQQEHQAAFTVAKAMQVDLLQDIRAAVDDALVKGTTLADFSKTLRPTLVKKGWWGKAAMADPTTGEIKNVQLGSPRRLKTIYDTNLRTAHSEGRWVRIQAASATFPFLMYGHTPGQHERKEHAAWNGLVLRVDDPFWKAHYPVKAWGCKCYVIQMSQRQLDRRGLSVGEAPAERYTTYTNKRTGETQQVPAGVAPEFHYPPGGRLANLGQMLADKIERMPAELGATAWTGSSEAMPALMQSWTAWVNAIEGGGTRGLGGRRVIAVMSPVTVSGLARAGVELASAAVSIEQRDVTHLFAELRKGSKAVPREWVYALPEHLAAADAVIYDAAQPGGALLYVWKLTDGRYVRVAVRPNFKLKGDAYTNAVRSGQIVDRRNLEGRNMTLLEGGL